MYLGNVYNITQYLDYHPGGVDEIMKGAGIDATALFQEIHSWVNKNDLLGKKETALFLGKCWFYAWKMSCWSIDYKT